MNFADPKSNILQLGLREGMKVADIGAGSGHYTLFAAASVGPSGKVYAIDIQEDVLTHILDITQRAGHRNVETIWGNIERAGGSRLRDHTLDAAVLSNVLFQVEHKHVLIEELKRVLKPEGKVLLIDWSGPYGGMGPAPAHVITERDAEALFTDTGFSKAKSFAAGAHHYAIVFTAPH